MTRQRFTVTVTREGPWWVGVVEGVRGAAVETRRLEALDDEVRDGLALLLEVDASDIDLTWDYHLPADARAALATYQAARAQREDAERAYQDSMRQAAHALARARVSGRDAAALMGLSHQRVHQLRTEGRPVGRRPKACA